MKDKGERKEEGSGDRSIVIRDIKKNGRILEDGSQRKTTIKGGMDG